MPTSSPGRLGINQKGLTLIELMVTMVIVGILFSIVAVSYSSLAEVNLKQAAARLGSTSRYLRNKAITQKAVYRLIYNLEEGTYQVEVTKDAFVIALTKEKPPVEGEESSVPAASFSADEEYLLEPVKLPRGVFFKDVWMPVMQEKRESGKAYTYFFPSGFVTKTIVHFRDDDDEAHYSLLLHPYSGQVEAREGYLEEDE
ncbi:MAG: prepilin-type N-terminal cleavage/methylation domain-containing protein [bacterium]|nr:prepilin-type N-terminal cleavage/methylation domain-containing protein [bacterium]